MRKSYFSNDVALQITGNWITVIIFCFFWVYGIFGFFTIPAFGLVTHAGLTIVLTCIILYLMYLRRREVTSHVSVYDDKYTFSYKDITLALVYCTLLGLLSLRELRVPLSGDNFYHAQQSQVYGVHLLQLISKYTHFFDTYSFSWLLWLINILTVAGIFLLYFLLKRFSFLVQATFVSIAFILLRTGMYLSGGNASPFPTLRLLPLWFTSTVFGVNEVAFRIASLIPLLGLMIVVYFFSKKTIGTPLAFLCGLAAGTIPVVWHTGLLVEFSIWTTVLFTYVLFFLHKKEENTLSYIRPVAVIAVSTMIRVSGFVALVPLFVHYLLSKTRTLKDIFSYIMYSLPAAFLIMPVIVGNLITGTSATYQGEGYPQLGIVEHSSLFTRLYVLLHDGYFYAIQYNSFHILPLIILCMLPFLIRTRNQVLIPSVILFSVCFLLFFSIRPVLWGNGRYQSEMIAPLIILSLFYCTVWLRGAVFTKEWQKSMMAIIFLTGFIACNIHEFKLIPKYNVASIGESDYFDSAKQKGKYFVLSEFPYDYKRALTLLKNEGYATSTYYIPGNGYSYFAKVLSGYSLSDMRYETTFRQTIGFEFSQENIGKILKNINETKEINVILLNMALRDQEFYPEQISKMLPSFGFKEWKQFKEPLYGNMIIGYSRQDAQ